VLQQIEDFGDPTVSANDAFRPVSRYWDRITRPEQLLSTLPRAMSVLTDAANCGPVTLALCQDVQAEAYDYPRAFFHETVWEQRRIRPDAGELERAIAALGNAKYPLIISGGGTIYSGARDVLSQFSAKHAIAVAETQAGKGGLAWDHPMNVGGLGVTGTSAANDLAAKADVILGIGTRLQDFTSGSRSLFANPDRILIQLNVTTFDGHKHGALPLVCDARAGLEALGQGMADYTAPKDWQDRTSRAMAHWQIAADAVMAPGNALLPSDAQVIGAVNGAIDDHATLVCAAGGLPGELHKLWRVPGAGGYHAEYGYSCMGYEIAAGLGVKMAQPDHDVVVMLGDGSYMMANSELATSVMMGLKIILVVLDNRGFGCINRLQMGCGSEPFNNLLDDARHSVPSDIDFRSHARSMGATAEKVDSLAGLEGALARAKASSISYVIVIDTDPLVSTQAGGTWWDVAIAEVSDSEKVQTARASYDNAKTKQRLGD
jgi:3D-(3,5/4)-trihydroxycyclohexane-1,2-dione acylhydrolase (decyclizing)